MSSVPARQHPHFERWALAQLRLYKPHRSVHELSFPSICSVFDEHVALHGFPNLPSLLESAEADDGDGENSAPRERDLLEPSPLETDLQQDDYHDLMNISRTRSHCSALLGARELDLIHDWPTSWEGIPFDALVSWIADIQDVTVLPPVDVRPLNTNSLSSSQTVAFDIVQRHCFGASQDEQLLMIVIGTAGTGKSFLISSIRSLFGEHGCTDQVKVTAPTGIAAANISGSTVYSLLSLLNTTLSGQRLVCLQKLMRDVRLLVIDEFSFLGAPVFQSLDRHLRLIFPLSDRPFGGLNILLCGDPAQLPPVHAQPMYAHCGHTAHLAALFHLFSTVVELTQPFRQTGNDTTQSRFRSLLQRVANGDADAGDWEWLQTRRFCCLSADENALFDDSMYIVATNAIRDKINYEKLAALAPIMKIEHSDEGVRPINENVLDGEHMDDKHLNLFAVGAHVILSTNLWTETGLVNGASGVVESILRPVTDSNTRVLMVNFPNYRGPSLLSHSPTVVPITHIRSKYFTGLPLSLSWAITIHKSQGMSLNNVTVNLGPNEFAAGLTFVALSRARRFDGLRVVGFDLDRYKSIEKGKNVEARRQEFGRLRVLAAATLSCVVHTLHCISCFFIPFSPSAHCPL